VINSNKRTGTQFLSQFLRTDFGIALCIALIWKVLLLIAGYLIDTNVNGLTPTLLHHTGMWDGGWYATVIQDRYMTNAASAAFYPLFPLLVGLVQAISMQSLDILTAGQVVNTAALWLTLAALLTLGRMFINEQKRFWLVMLVLSSPAAFFLHVFYGEALFMAIGLWAYIFALRRQWLFMGILLGFLTAARLPSILFVGLCGLEFMRVHGWSVRNILNKNLLYFLLAPVGFITYGIYLFIVRGDFLGMFHAYQATADWSYHIFDINFLMTILNAAREVFLALIGERDFNIAFIISHIIPVSSLALLGIASFYATFIKREKYLPLGVFGLFSIVMFTLNSNVISVHRYVLPCLTIYLVFLYITMKFNDYRIILAFVCLSGLTLQFLLFTLFISNMFAG
jgi:hypothetical protein